MTTGTDVKPTKEWDDLYWAYNCPLQMWPNEDGWRVINYMPRKECCGELEVIVTPEEMPTFCSNAAARLRNLASLFEAMSEGKIKHIYYPDATIEDE